MVGVVLEDHEWRVKIYAPPREHGPPHVHAFKKGTKYEVKISLVDLRVMGHTKMSRRNIKTVVYLIWENYDYLKDCWESLHEKK